MNKQRLDEIVQDQFRHCFDVLEVKGKEYAPGADRLEHFRSAAAMEGITPKMALWGMASKHLTSLSSMCKIGDRLDKNLWLEKLTDSINYLLLLRALVEEDGGQNEEH